MVKDNLSVRKRLWEVVVDVLQVWKVEGDPVPTYLTPEDLAYDANVVTIGVTLVGQDIYS